MIAADEQEKVVAFVMPLDEAEHPLNELGLAVPLDGGRQPLLKREVDRNGRRN
ncbi:hypothetical protein GCM10027427_17980 [Pseudoclavibacter terrae]